MPRRPGLPSRSCLRQSGGWLFVIEVGAPIATLPAAGLRLEVGVLVKLFAQSTGANVPGSASYGSVSTFNIFRQEGDTRSAIEFGVGAGVIEEVPRHRMRVERSGRS